MLRLQLQSQLKNAVKSTRMFSSTATKFQMDSYESEIYSKLKTHFNPSDLIVKDVSGGCGSMFAIQIESENFKGIPMIKQHRLVNQLLKDDIKNWHGLQLKTSAPKKNE